MLYEKITAQDLKAMYREDGFTPNYTYENYVFVEDKETGEILEEYYTNLTIHKTADEVYEEWLYNEENPSPQPPTQIEILSDDVESLKKDNASQEELILDSFTAQAELYETTITQEEQIMDSYMAQAELYELVLTMQQEIETLKQSKN